jgi:hypothetical protein
MGEGGIVKDYGGILKLGVMCKIGIIDYSVSG